MQPAVVSKTEFARLCNVTPTRVGQWIRERKIGGEALVGEGRFAQIDVEVARRQLHLTRDPSQALGNGDKTVLGPAPAPTFEDAPAAPATMTQLQAAKLEQMQFDNLRRREEALARRGAYVRADATAAAMTKTVGKMLIVFEAGLNEIAGELAAVTGVERREVVHRVRAAWLALRAKAAEAARREAGALPALVEDQVPDALDPAIGEA
jgi:hypothetical protein